MTAQGIKYKQRVGLMNDEYIHSAERQIANHFPAIIRGTIVKNSSFIVEI